MPAMTNQFLGKLGYQKPSQPEVAPHWQLPSAQFQPQDLGETFSFDDGSYRPPDFTTPQEPSWIDNFNNHEGTPRALMAAGAALLNGEGWGGGMNAFQGSLENTEQKAAQAEQQAFENDMATQRFGLQSDQFDYRQAQDAVKNSQWEQDYVLREADSIMKRESLPYDLAYKKAKAAKAMREAQDPNYGNQVTYGDYRNVLDKDGNVLTQVRLGNGNQMVDLAGNPFQFDPNSHRLEKDSVKRDRSNITLRRSEDSQEKITFDYDPNKREYFGQVDGQWMSQKEFLQKYPQGLKVTDKEIGMDKESLKDLHKIEDELLEVERGYRMMNRYSGLIDSTPDGGQRYFERALGNLKTLVGQGHSLTDIQKDIKEGGNLAQSIVGLIREDVVGGGVMTEQDALRVLMAMGGDPNNIVWNKEVALRMVGELNEQRMIDLRRRFENYNLLREKRGLSRYEGTFYKPYEAEDTPAPITPPDGAKILDFSTM